MPEKTGPVVEIGSLLLGAGSAGSWVQWVILPLQPSKMWSQRCPACHLEARPRNSVSLLWVGLTVGK